MPGAQPPLFVVPLRNINTLCTVEDGKLVPIQQVPVPLLAKYAISSEGWIAFLADEGRSIGRAHTDAEPSQQDFASVPLPGETKARCLVFYGQTLFVGAGNGSEMLGWLDFRQTEPVWQPVSLPVPPYAPQGKAIDALVLTGTQLLALDDIVYPSYLFELIVTERDAYCDRTHQLPSHITYEHYSVAALGGRWLALLSGGINHGWIGMFVSLIDPVFYEEQGQLRVTGRHSGRFADDDPTGSRSRNWHDLAWVGDLLLIAAGEHGVALCDLSGGVSRSDSPKVFEVSLADRLPGEVVRLHSVPGQQAVLAVIKGAEGYDTLLLGEEVLRTKPPWEVEQEEIAALLRQAEMGDDLRHTAVVRNLASRLTEAESPALQALRQLFDMPNQLLRTLRGVEQCNDPRLDELLMPYTPPAHQLSELLLGLAEPNEVVRGWCLMLLARLDSEAMPHRDAIARCLQDPLPQIRALAIRCLQRLSASDSDGAAAQAIAPLVEDPDATVVQDAVQALCQLPEVPPTIAPALQRFAEQGSAELRDDALRLLAKVMPNLADLPASLLQAMLQFNDEADGPIVHRALRALPGDQLSDSELRSLLHHAHAPVRSAAVELLADRGPWTTWNLTDLLLDSNSEVFSRGERLLDAQPIEAERVRVDLLERCLGGQLPDTSAANVLARIGGSLRAPLQVIEWMLQGEPRLSWIDKLAPCVRPWHAPLVPDLLNALESPRADVTLWILSVLTQLGPAAGAALPTLEKLVQAPPKPYHLAPARNAIQAIRGNST